MPRRDANPSDPVGASPYAPITLMVSSELNCMLFSFAKILLLNGSGRVVVGYSIFVTAGVQITLYFHRIVQWSLGQS
jgi:hypothetical protein